MVRTPAVLPVMTEKSPISPLSAGILVCRSATDCWKGPRTPFAAVAPRVVRSPLRVTTISRYVSPRAVPAFISCTMPTIARTPAAPIADRPTARPVAPAAIGTSAGPSMRTAATRAPMPPPASLDDLAIFLLPSSTLSSEAATAASFSSATAVSAFTLTSTSLPSSLSAIVWARATPSSNVRMSMRRYAISSPTLRLIAAPPSQVRTAGSGARAESRARGALTRQRG